MERYLAIATAPASEPVTTAEAKLHCKIDLSTTDLDAEVGRQIQAAREQVEMFTRRALMSQTWDLYMDRFPEVCDANPYGAIELPLPPLSSVTHVKYVAADGTLTTLVANTDYRVLGAGATDRGQIVLPYGGSWPSPRLQPDAVQIRFVCGYASASAVPARAKQAILMYVEDQYDASRGTFITGTTATELPFAAKQLLWGLRSLEIAAA